MSSLLERKDGSGPAEGQTKRSVIGPEFHVSMDETSGDFSKNCFDSWNQSKRQRPQDTYTNADEKGLVIKGLGEHPHFTPGGIFFHLVHRPKGSASSIRMWKES